MSAEFDTSKIDSFRFEGQEQPVSFIKTVPVTDGVECDVYTFVEDKDKDLGIIRIQPGSSTPSQKVLIGDRTIEGYLAGKGKFTLTKPDGQVNVYVLGDSEKTFSTTVEIGELMQWEADSDSSLVAYEICFPPYEDGRFENIV